MRTGAMPGRARWTVVIGLAAMLAVGLAAIESPAASDEIQAQGVLFGEDAPTARSAGPLGTGVLRERQTLVDTSTVVSQLIVGDPDDGVDLGDGRWLLVPRPVTVQLFDGVQLTFEPVEATATSPSIGDVDGTDISPKDPTALWIGQLPGPFGHDGSVSLTLSPLPGGGYQTEALFELAGQVITAEPVDGDLHVLKEFDPDHDWGAGHEHDHVLLPDHEDEPDDPDGSGAGADDNVDGESDGGVTPMSHPSTSTIDIMIVRATNVTTSGSSMVNQLNQAFANSGSMTMTGNLVRLRNITYAQSSSLSTDLDRIRQGTSPFGVVHTERDTYKADLVVLVVPNVKNNVCGSGYLTSEFGRQAYAYSVVAETCIAGFTFTHEVGHNLGGHHNPEDTGSEGCYPFSYSCGHRVKDKARSVMAYDYSGCNCPRRLQFSSPNVNFSGTTVKSGTSSKDNRRSLIEMAWFTREYRTGDPIGAFSSATAGATELNIGVDGVNNGLYKRSIRVQGWALDPNTRSSTSVEIRVDGVLVATVNATKSNTFVGSHYPRHLSTKGFDYSFDQKWDPILGSEAPPTVRVCITARNYPGTPGVNRSLGCRNV